SLHAAKFEQLQAQTPLLLRRTPLVPDDALIGNSKRSRKAPVAYARPGVKVDGRIAEEVLHLGKTTSEIDEQGRAFVAEAAADRVGKRQPDDKGPVANRRRDELMCRAEVVVVDCTYPRIPVARYRIEKPECFQNIPRTTRPTRDPRP